MELNISTPALLFSTISLLMIAFTNRFMAMASLIRGLHEKFQKNPENTLLMQIMNLRKRMSLIRNMQIIAIVSLLFSVFCMFSLFFEYANVARWLFGISLAGMSIALVMSAWEITISTNALEVELSDMQEIIEKKK